MEPERLNSLQRRKVQRNVRHMLDEEDSKRNETWRDGVERLPGEGRGEGRMGNVTSPNRA